MKRQILIIIPALLFILPSCHKKNTDKSADQPETVNVAVPEIDSVVLYNTYPGYLEATQSVDLMARVNGYLKEITYNDGQFVKKGTVLFRIEDTQYRDALAQAEASLNTARATLEYNSKNYEAMKRALQSNAVSQISVIEAESDMKNSEAAVKNAQAALETARTNLNYCTVRAPFDGHVSASPMSVGTYLTGAGQAQTLATIYDDSTLKATFNVAETTYIQDLSDVAQQRGLNLHAIPVNFSDSLAHSYVGDLYYIAPSVDTSTGTLSMSAHVRNPYGELKPGMFVSISLPYKYLSDAILVKSASISTDQAGKFLYTVNDSNRVVYTPIVVGDDVRDSMTIVSSGIKPGERYVTQALLKVRDGMTVKPNLTK